MTAQAENGSALRTFVAGFDDFLADIASVNPLLLLIGLSLFAAYLSLRARAYLNIIRAAYPNETIPYSRIWGAYFAAYGFNNVVPARGGDVIRLFLTKTSVPNSSYPAVTSSLAIELIFDAVMAPLVVLFALSQDVFPALPQFARLPAVDLTFLLTDPRMLLFAVTVVGVLVFVSFGLLSARVRAFWKRLRQGVAILGDRRRYLREVFAVQFAAWLVRCSAFWFLLEAFAVGGSVRNVLLVLSVNAIAALVPFTPGGAGIQQALLVTVLAGTASAATITAYSVGVQVAIGLVSLAIGFAALVFIFRLRSFKEVIARGREARTTAKA